MYTECKLKYSVEYYFCGINCKSLGKSNYQVIRLAIKPYYQVIRQAIKPYYQVIRLAIKPFRLVLSTSELHVLSIRTVGCVKKTYNLGVGGRQDILDLFACSKKRMDQGVGSCNQL